MDPMFALVLFALFIAAFLQRVAGFGYGLIGAPFALTIFTPFEVSFLMAFWGSANSLPTILLLYSHIRWDIYRKLFIWLCLGLVLGYVGLLFLPASVFKLLAVVICVQAIVSVFRPDLATKGISWTADHRVASTIAGTLQSSVAIPGPPLVVAFNAMKLTQNAFVSLFALVFLSVGVMRIGVSMGFVIVGLYSEGMAERLPDDIIFNATTGSLVSIAGVLIAQPLVRHLSTAFFKKIAATLIAVSALTLIIDVFGWGPRIAALFGIGV